MLLHEKLYQIKAKNVLLWSESEENISFSFDKAIGFPAKLQDYVKKNKSEIIKILRFNKIFTEKNARDNVLYKIPSTQLKGSISEIQKGMYIQDISESTSCKYTIPVLFRLRSVDVSMLRAAIKTFLQLNPILRISVSHEFEYSINPVADFVILESEVDDANIASLCKDRAKVHFDLDSGKLITIEIIKIKNTDDVILNLTHHHILSDAYSFLNLIPMIIEIYSSTGNGSEHGFLTGKYDYLDYIPYQRFLLQTTSYQEAINRLCQQLNNAEVLSLESNARLTDNDAYGEFSIQLSEDLCGRLQSIALNENISLYSILLTCFYRTLSIYANAESGFPVGITIANRIADVSRAIGPFINVMPFMLKFDNNSELGAVIKLANDLLIYLNEHNQLNISTLVENITNKKRNMLDVIEVMFTFHNFKPDNTKPKLNHENLYPYGLAEKHGLTVIAKEESDRVIFDITYSEAKYEASFLTTLFRSFLSLLEKLSDTTLNQTLKAITLVDDDEYQAVVRQSQGAVIPFSEHKCLHQLFEEQTFRTPNAIAVIAEQRRFSYIELNKRANQLANYLTKTLEVSSGDLVCLCLERSERLLISIYAILKAGAAYVPIAPDFPLERINYILEHTGAKAVICSDRQSSLFTQTNETTTVNLDNAELKEILLEENDSNLNLNLSSESLAYVIYTSGTTGNPKGVMLEHRGVVNRIEWMNSEYPLTAKDTVLQKTPYIFDVSVWELLWASWYGAKTVFAKPDGHKDPEYLIEMIASEKITVCHFVPSMLQVFLQAIATARHDLPSLQKIFCSGEALHLSQVKRCHELLPNVEIHNLYGPTEASIDVLYYDCTSKFIDNVYIGKPIANTVCLILDADGNLLPRGAVGELYVGGVGLARGYLNNSTLTDEKFIDNTFKFEKIRSSKIYKTGDLAQWSCDGNIRYLGRNDFQIKLNGYRIELQEIESILIRHTDIEQCAVLLTETPSKQHKLVAYYTSSQKLDEKTIMDKAKRYLPEYMIPDLLYPMESFPVTLNGKLDRKSLPSPDYNSLPTQVESAREQDEDKILNVWAKLLNIDKDCICITNDFFKLGGDSILAIQLVGQLRQLFKTTINVSDIYRHRSIKGFYDSVIKNNAESNLSIETLSEQGLLSGEFPLLPIQKWYFSCVAEMLPRWSQTFIIKTPLLNIARLKSSCSKLVEYHDSFNTVFTESSDGIQQAYVPSQAEVPLLVVDLQLTSERADLCSESDRLDQLVSSLQNKLDFINGPLYYIAYIHGFNDASARIYFILHHLIIDTVSWRIIAEDLKLLYDGKQLPKKGTSYRQWINSSYALYKNVNIEFGYWTDMQRQVESSAGQLELLLTHSKRYDSLIKLNESLTKSLLREVHDVYHTNINDFLVSSLAAALADITGDSEHYIMQEGHGREDSVSNTDVNRTVGWFTTLYPVKIKHTADIGETLKSNKEFIRNIPRNGLGYGYTIGYDDVALPKICLNYLGQFDESVSDADWSIQIKQSADIALSKGETQFPISIFSYIADTKLVLHISSYLSETIAAKFSAAFEQHLVNAIEYCKQAVITQYTESDFRGVISENDLASLPVLVVPEDSAGWFDMTEIQKAYLLGRLDNYEIGYVANHIYNEFYYDKLNVPRLERAINYLIKTTAALRTVYSYKTLKQRYLSNADIVDYKIAVNDFSADFFNPDLLQPVKDKLSHKSYDPEKFPLFTFEVSQFSNLAVLHVSLDLICLDVQSRIAFFRMLDQLYRDDQISLPRLNIGFHDYQNYMALLRHSEWYARDKRYWTEKIPHMPLRPQLSFRNEPETIERPSFSEHTLYIERDVWKKFKEKANQLKLSPTSMLLALYGSVISYYSGTLEFLITLTLFNRYPIHDDVNKLLGDFTSVSVFHFKDDHLNMNRFMQDVHQSLWSDISHSLYSGLDVQRDIRKFNKLDVNKSVSPIVFTGVIGSRFDEFDKQSFLEDGEKPEKRYWCAQTSQAWLDLQAVEVNDTLMSKWLFVDQLFDDGYVEQLNYVFCSLIRKVASEQWDGTINYIDCLSQADTKLIQNINSSELQILPDTLFARCEKIINQKKLFASIAVIDEGNNAKHSYEKLLFETDLISKYIFKHISAKFADTKDHLVGILCEKGYSQVLLCFSIMKASYAYLPLSVDWPRQRIQDVLDEGKVSLVFISQEQARDKSLYDDLSKKYEVLVIEEILTSILTSRNLQDDLNSIVLPVVKPDQVAYVIFTSGSTGKPKGVTISHAGALNTIEAVNDHFHVGEHDTILALSELSFDLSVYDIFGLLIAGGCIVYPCQNKLKEPSHWLELVQKYHLTLWNTVPQIASLLIDEAEGKPIHTLRLFLLSGDWIPTTLPGAIQSCCKNAIVMSLGGATEGSIWSIWYEIKEVRPEWKSIPYGTAMPNQKMYVLNTSDEFTPTNVTGEIYIGGKGVALDYWQNPLLTSERFIQHKLLGKLYKTGDLGRVSPEGYIEFLGRNDFQVKINGYRVELEEIERVILSITDVKQCVVMMHIDSSESSKNTQSILIAYYVASNDLSEDTIGRQASTILPEYMVPQYFISINKLPLTANGKLDRNALPKPSIKSSAITLPSNEYEMKILSIWAELLKLDESSISTTDDFFRLGGDSILAIQLVSRLRKLLNMDVTLKDIFLSRTVLGLSKKVHDRKVMSSMPAQQTEQGRLSGRFPLLPIQKWFFSSEFPVSEHWNLSFSIKVPKLDIKRLQHAFNALVDWHDCFNLRFTKENENYIQYYDEGAPCEPIKVIDIRNTGYVYGSPEFSDSLRKILTASQANFDLHKGPIYSINYLVGYSDNSARIYIALHHLVVDAVSIPVLVEDLYNLYMGNQLGNKRTSYRQWVSTATEFAAKHTTEIKYWDKIISTYQMKSDPIISSLENANNVNEAVTKLDESLTALLLRDCHHVYQTNVNEVLLAALLVTLQDYIQLQNYHILLEGHGREAICDTVDITRTIGWFTTMYPVCLKPANSLSDAIVQVKDNMHSVPFKGLNFSSLMDVEPKKLPKVRFNYLGNITNSGNKDAEWVIDNNSYGESVDPVNVSPDSLDIVIYIDRDKLNVKLIGKFTESVLECFAKKIVTNITELVSQLTAIERTYLTCSDIGYLVDQNTLMKLQNENELESIYLANSLQQGFVVHSLSKTDSDDAYRLQIIWEYGVEITPEHLKSAWEIMQRKYSNLRLRFSWQTEVIQCISETGVIAWQYIDLTSKSSEQEIEIAINEIVEQDRKQAYSLDTEFLFRIYLVKKMDDKFYCLLNIHQAIIDGWSVPLLLNDLHETYLKICAGQSVIIDKDGAYKEAQLYLQNHSNDHLDFWKNYVSEFDDYLDLRGLFHSDKRQIELVDYKRVELQKEKLFVIEDALLDNINDLVLSQNVTVNALLQFIWHKVLSIYSGSQKTAVGTVVSGRNLPVNSIEKSVGLYINTLPIIVDHGIAADADVFELIRILQEDINESNVRSNVNLADLQKNGQRLFVCLFMYGNYPKSSDDLYQKKLKLHFLPGLEKHDYPLTVSVDVKNEKIIFRLSYDSELFLDSSISNMLKTYQFLLKQIVFNSDIKLCDLRYIDDESYKQLLYSINPASHGENFNATIHGLFEKSVDLYSEGIALQVAGVKLTYKQLESSANKLARFINKNYSNDSESLILLCLDRSVDLVVSILAVLKSGCAYVPMDPGYPLNRKKQILSDSRPILVLTSKNYQHEFLDSVEKIVCLDDSSVVNQIARQSESRLNLPVFQNQLAYVLYTSGSTGRPKGVMVEHGSFVQLITSVKKKYFSFDGRLSTHSLTNYVFDIFGLEYGLSLLSGGTLTLSVDAYSAIDCRGLDFLQVTPSVLEMKLDQLKNTEATKLIVGGEALSTRLLTKALKLFNVVLNVYGPTETTIWSTSKAYTETPNFISIGKPFDNEAVFIFDKNMQVVPVGAVGELYIGGAGLARGYLNRDDLTKERFIDNPLQSQLDGFKHIYKTGDLVRRLDNGELEFIGRCDTQVKIRGHRIELHEIESCIINCTGVKQCVVTTKQLTNSLEDDGVSQYLVAYYVADIEIDNDNTVQLLAEYLPDYMIPRVYVAIPEVPLTASGKLNYSALPKSSAMTKVSQITPTDANQKCILTLWASILGIDSIGLHDNFFDLGGNSILLVKMYSMLPESIRSKIGLVDLFKLPTISAICEYLAEDTTNQKHDKKAYVSHTSNTDDMENEGIAIIGMAGRFPEADNLDEYWSNLINGKSGIRYYDKSELNQVGIDDETLNNPHYVMAQSCLRDIKSFDAEFFGYSPKEASIIEPQHRLFMECTWHALEDANYNPDSYEGDIGVYAGCGENNYMHDHVIPTLKPDDLATHYQIMVNTKSAFLATKIAYKLNLTGPAMTIETACSTSLVAVHQACLALQNGDCDMAIAGGVSIGQLAKRGYLYEEGMIFSPDGACRPFDKDAAGTIEGQGVGVVILKPKARAIADEDRIYAVIKASAINNDGHKKIGYTAPSATRQAAVIRAALRKANINSNSVGYIETHGTGTKLGDPIEVDALISAYSDASGSAPKSCALGSVKASIGHLDVAAGVAGLIKATLCIYHKTLVPTLNFKQANPQLNFSNTPFYINTETKSWEPSSLPRRAGVSSFGIGGTNAHVILEESCNNDDIEPVKSESSMHLIMLSANSTNALMQMKYNLVSFLQRNQYVDLERLSYTLLKARQQFRYNVYYVTSRKDDLMTQLIDKNDVILKDYTVNIEAQLHQINEVLLSNSLSRDIINKTLLPKEIEYLNSVPGFEEQGDIDEIVLKVLGELLCRGIKVNCLDLHKHSNKRLHLPKYPFEKINHWIDNPSHNQYKKIINQPVDGVEKNTYAGMLDTLSGYFKEILGYDHIDRDADFFDLGADSLDALQLSNKLHKHLGVKLELLSLKKISVSELANYLMGCDASSPVGDSSFLVTLNKGAKVNNKLPLILIHPIGGDVYFYREIANGLPSNQPVFAIRSPILHSDVVYDDIANMAESYIQMLYDMGLQPPFILGGSSFGGIVAYEMSQQLSEKGNSPPLLVMIDSPAHANLPKEMTDNEILTYLIKYGLASLNLSQEEIDKCSNFLEKIEYISDAAKGTKYADMVSEEVLPRLIGTWQAHYKLMKAYVPKPYSGEVLFFSHTEVIHEFPTKQYQAWMNLFRGKCNNIYVPGNHLSMNAQPNVSVLIEHLTSHIDKLKNVKTDVVY